MENKFKKGDKIKLNGKLLKDSLYLYAHKFSNNLSKDKAYTVESISIEGNYENDIRFPAIYIEEEDGKYCFHPEDIFELEEESKVIVINPTKSNVIEEDTELDLVLDLIYLKDEEFFNELDKLIKYLASTYADKYESTDKPVFNAKSILLSKEGKAANMFTVSKYLNRYNTSGFSKSENTEDILKAIHYLLFELQRKTICK